MSKRSVEKRLARKREEERRRRKRERRMRQIRIWTSAAIAIAVVVALVFVFAGSGKKTPTAATSLTPSPTPTPTPTGVPCIGPTPQTAHPKTYSKYPPTVISQSKKYEVTMVTSCGTLHMTLDPKVAPKAVNNLVYLIRQGFFNGLTFHRIEEQTGFQLVQGGDPLGTGMGGPGYGFATEKPTPSASSPYVRPSSTTGSVTYLAGVVAMAHSSQPNSNGSQFFIDVSDVQLPLDYSVMGKVDSASLEVLKKMVAVPVVNGNQPQPKVYIISATVKAI